MVRSEEQGGDPACWAHLLGDLEHEGEDRVADRGHASEREGTMARSTQDPSGSG